MSRISLHPHHQLVFRPDAFSPQNRRHKAQTGICDSYPHIPCQVSLAESLLRQQMYTPHHLDLKLPVRKEADGDS